MKTVTVDQFKKFKPCWLKTRDGRERFERIAAIRDEWTALDVLALPDVSLYDKLWAVLREDFIPAETLHEYACRCAELALSTIDNPDPRSVAAIDAKRKWMRGEIDDDELGEARAAAWAAALDDAGVAALDAALDDARAAAWAAAWAAARAAAGAAAGGVGEDAVLTILRDLLTETEG